MKTRARIYVVSLVIILAGILCTGCIRPPETGATKSSTTSSESAPHPADYYEGYWLCNGYTKDGETVSYNNLSSEERKSFPYLILEMGKAAGSLSQISNDDGEYIMIFGGDSCPTSNGIALINEEGGLNLVLDGDSLAILPEEAEAIERFVKSIGLHPDYSLPQGEATYYFERTVFDSQLKVVTYEFDDITLDVPVDIAYSLNMEGPDNSDDDGATTQGISYRSYGPRMSFASWPTEANNMAEVIAESEGRDYCIEHADEFTEYRGVLYHLYHNEELNYSRLGFVANGKLYEIVFDYEDEDIVDYSDYCEYFFTSIRFAGEIPAGEQPDTIPSGAFSWQEASQHVGETVTVYGPVAEVDYASTSDGQPTFIDLGVAYPDESRVTMVIWGEDRGAFPESPETMYAGKTLVVTGEVYLYEGVCNIEVTSPSQVQVL